MARRDLLFCLALLLATLAVYSQVAHFDFVNYDDQDYTTANRHIRTGLTAANIGWAFTSSYAANWFPLTWISHMLDFQFFGPNAGAAHITNLILHIINTLLLFFVLQRMTTASIASAFVAAVFAVHPLHVESVAWVAERKDLLCTMFFLLTIAAYVEFVRHPTTTRYALVIAAFACALMSKPMAITLPFLLLLLDYWPLRQFTLVSMRRLVMEKIPLFVLAIASSIVTFLVQRGGGAVIDTVPFGTRLENALVSYGVYLVKFVWPANLAVFYPYTEVPAWQPVAAAAGIISMSVFVVMGRKKRQSLLVGWFWFLGTLIPVIGLVQVGMQSRADRYTYIPMIGIAIMLAWRVKAFVKSRKWVRPPAGLAAAIVLAVWGTMAWRGVKYWHDSVALFQHAIDVTPGNYVAYNNLGWAIRTGGHPHEAIPYFERALTIRPHYADAESGLGDSLSADHRFEEAMPHIIEAVRLEPNSVACRVNLGAAYSRQGRVQESAEEYRKALAIDPESAEAHCGLGVELTEQGRLQEAIPQLQESVRINPDYGDGHYNLGRVYGLQARHEEAMIEFREAIRVEPNNPEAHYNLGVALAARDRTSQAAEEFRTAVDLKPDYVNARFGYASSLATMENYPEAIMQFQGLLRLAPGLEPAERALALCIYLRDHPESRPTDGLNVVPNAAPDQRPHRTKRKHATTP